MQQTVRKVLDDTLARLVATFWAGGPPEPALIAKVKAMADEGKFATGGLVGMCATMTDQAWIGADGVRYVPGTVTSSGYVVDYQPGILWSGGFLRIKAESLSLALDHGWCLAAEVEDGWVTISRRAQRLDGYHGHRVPLA